MENQKHHIVLVEDEQEVADLVVQGLEEDGYKVTHISCEEGLRALLQENNISLVLLDILLPVTNGLEICKNIRNWGYSDLPVMMLTALGSPENVVLGLDSGADDYLSKPFKLIELKARVRSLIRRKVTIQESVLKNQSDDNVIQYEFLKIDLYSKIAYCDDVALQLTSTEYRLLQLFVQSPKKVFERSELLDKVWGINFDIGSNVVDVYVNYLRKKLEKISHKRIIHTVIGMGYVLKIDN